MTIAYVGNFHQYSVGEPEIANCLEKEGHTVIRVPERDTNVYALDDIIKRNKCGLLLFAKFRIDSDENEKRDFLKRLKIPSCAWLFDLYFGY